MILEDIIKRQKQQIERLEKVNDRLKEYCDFYKDLSEKQNKTIKQLEEKIDSVKESYETDAEAKYYDYVDKYESKLQERIDKAIETINYYAIEDEDYSKIYNTEEQELYEILKGE